MSVNNQNRIRTSETDPIILDPIAYGAGQKGILYQSIAPGKKKINWSKPSWDRDLQTDLTRIRDTYAVTWIISYLEPEEARKLSLEYARTTILDNGFGFINYPIPDTKNPPDLNSLHQLVCTIRTLLNEGHSILSHCMGGLGRSGTVNAGVLISSGYSCSSAILWIQKQRPGSLTRKNQQKFLKQYEEYCRTH